MRDLFEINENTTYKNVLKLLGKSDEKVNEAINKMKQWFKIQPHIPEVMDEDYIRNFLIFNKNDLEKTQEKVNMYYKVRQTMPHIFCKSNRKLEVQKKVMDTIYLVPLPKLYKDMYRVFVFKVRDKELIDFLDPYIVLGFVMNLQEIRLKEDVIVGDMFIIDFENIGNKFLKKCTVGLIYEAFVNIYKGIFSAPLKAMYIINAPPIVELLLALTRSIIKTRLFAYVNLCKDSTVINEKFSKEILPKDYGGEGKSLEEIHEVLSKKFIEYQDRFNEMDKFSDDGGCDIQDTFKNLQID